MNATLLAIAAVALGQAVQVRDGLYDPLAIVLLTTALLACIAAFVRRRGSPPGLGVDVILAGGLLLQFLELFVRRPGSEAAVARGAGASMVLHGCLGVAMIATTVIVFGGARWRAAFWTAAAAQLAAAFWFIHATPLPYMDVWWAQQAGLEALVDGRSPFSSRFSDIYGGVAQYPAGFRDGPWILVGFPYPPLVLLTGLPSFLIAGDLRYGNAVAFAAAGILIGHVARTRVAALAALTLLFSPRVFFFLESGWAEPTAILAFAAAVFCAVRAVPLLPLALGLAAVSKQVMPLILPLVPLLRGQIRALAGRPALLAAFFVGPAITLAAVALDACGFVRSAIEFPAAVPLRSDILSYLAMAANVAGFRSSTAAVVAGFGLAAFTIVVLLRAGPRTAAGFAAATALTFLVFFAFNKYSGCNYWFFVIAALCSAVAAHTAAGASPEAAGTDGVEARALSERASEA